MDYGNPYLFTGRRVDILDNNSLKIQYNRNRYYDQYTGRWLTHDPLGIDPAAGTANPFLILSQYSDGLSLYGYVQDNPVVSLDPLGTIKGLDCIVCGLALTTKFGGSYAGAVFICKDAEEETSGRMSWGECINKIMTELITPCELWRAFKGNPNEWVAAGACVSCGVTLIKEIMDGPPEGCDDCGCPDEKSEPVFKFCAPCVPPVGTGLYEVDIGHTHWPHGDPHTHHRVVHQSPVSAGCVCWPSRRKRKSMYTSDGISPYPGDVYGFTVTGGGVIGE